MKQRLTMGPEMRTYRDFASRASALEPRNDATRNKAMKKVIGFAMALAIMSVAGSISAAVTYEYSGLGASGSWTDPANWTASDGSTSGYPGVEITDIAVFPKDAGPVAFDFGKTELTIGELNVTSDVTAEITLKNVTMTVASKLIFAVGTSVRLSDSTSLAVGDSSTSDPEINGTFVVDKGCDFTSAPNRYSKVGAQAVIRVAGKVSMPNNVTRTSGAQFILEGGEYYEKSKQEDYAKHTRDLSFVTGVGVFNKRDCELNFSKDIEYQPMLAAGVTYVWGQGTGGSDARMNLTCGTIEFVWQTAGNSQFYSTAKRSGFNFVKRSTAKVVFSQYTPKSVEEMFATELFSPGSSANGPHIYVEGAAVKSAEHLRELFDIDLPYADGKGVALSLKNTMPTGASVLTAAPLPKFSGNEIAFSGAFRSLGVGTTTVSLEWWVDAAVTNKEHIASFSSTETELSFAKSVIFKDWPSAVNWRFVSANGTVQEGEFSDSTEWQIAVISDSTTYTWKSGVSSGKWNDPANWTASSTPCRGYPNDYMATANFSNPGDVVVDCSGQQLSLVKLSVANGCGRITLSGGTLSVGRIDLGNSSQAACVLNFENACTLNFRGGSYVAGGQNANIWGRLEIGENCSFRQYDWTLELKQAGDRVVVKNGAELTFDEGSGALNFFHADAKIRLEGGTVRRNKTIAYNSEEFGKFLGNGLVEWDQFQFNSAGGVTSDLTIPEGVTFSFSYAEYGSGSVVNLLGDGRLCFRYGLSDHPNGAFWDVNRFNLSSESKMKVELPNYSEMTWRQVYDLLFSPEAADGKYYFLLDGAAVTSALAFRKSILVESPMEGAEKGVCFGWKTPLGLMLILR